MNYCRKTENLMSLLVFITLLIYNKHKRHQFQRYFHVNTVYNKQQIMENQSSNTNSSTSSDSDDYDYYIAAAMEAPISDDDIDESEIKQENAELKARIITLKETNAVWKEYLHMADDEEAKLQQIIANHEKTIEQLNVKLANETDDADMTLDEYESELLDGIEQLERRLRELDNQQKGAAAEDKVEEEGKAAMDIHSKRQEFLYGEAGDDYEEWMEKYAKLKELYDAQEKTIERLNIKLAIATADADIAHALAHALNEIERLKRQLREVNKQPNGGNNLTIIETTETETTTTTETITVSTVGTTRTMTTASATTNVSSSFWSSSRFIKAILLWSFIAANMFVLPLFIFDDTECSFSINVGHLNE